MTKTNYPENTDNKIYLLSGCDHTLGCILDIARNKWGQDIDLDDIKITSEYIQTRCIGYDIYDSSDYDDYIVLEIR